jgi:hypothetical protein
MILQDSAHTNFTVEQSLVYNSLKFVSQTIALIPVAQDSLAPEGDQSYLLTPSALKTIYTFATENNDCPSLEMQFDIDSSASQIGDVILLVFNNTAVEEVAVISLSDQFFYTGCGSVRAAINVPASFYTTEDVFVLSGVAIPFMYDGELWVNTTDNC